MTMKTLAFTAAALGVAWSVAGAYTAGPVTDGGSISGKVKMTGAAPAPKPIDITKDKEVCGTSPKVDESLVVASDGGVKNAVVSITKIDKGKAFDTAKPVLDQKGCTYLPRVLLTPAGGEIDISNDDGILHNIHTYSKKNPAVNRAQPKFKKVIQETFKDPEVFEVRCDAHGWMQGWVVVMDHPYYTTTDATGAFKLTDVPPGEYEVKMWHEKLGEKTTKVTVPAKGDAAASFEVAPPA